nr:MAG TPA: hypothetical protein [Caudoviricetes sp.]
MGQIIFAFYKRVLNQQFAKSSTLYFYFLMWILSSNEIGISLGF